MSFLICSFMFLFLFFFWGWGREGIWEAELKQIRILKLRHAFMSKEFALRSKPNVSNGSVLNVPSKLLGCLEMGSYSGLSQPEVVPWASLSLWINSSTNLMLRKLLRTPCLYLRPALDKGHPLVGLTRISISILTLGNVTCHEFESQNEAFWKSNASPESGIFIWVK